MPMVIACQVHVLHILGHSIQHYILNNFILLHWKTYHKSSSLLVHFKQSFIQLPLTTFQHYQQVFLNDMNISYKSALAPIIYSHEHHLCPNTCMSKNTLSISGVEEL